VVIKIDIDTSGIEARLLSQIAAKRELSDRIDELFYEDHVHGHPFMHGGPWAYMVNDRAGLWWTAMPSSES